MKARTIMFDVDGVLADFMTGFTRLAHEKSGGQTPVFSHLEAARWDFPHQDFPESLVEDTWRSVKTSSTFWLNLPQIASSYELQRVHELWAFGHNLYFVTSRPGVATKSQTEEWVKRFTSIPFPTVIVTPLKAVAARAIGAHYSVEDKAGNAVNISYEIHEGGHTVSYLLDRKYNQFDPQVLGSKVRRVKTLGKFLDDVEAGR